MLKEQFRNTLYLLATDLLNQFTKSGTLLVNLFGIDGMGKSSFISHVLPIVLKKSGVRYKILSISSKSKVTELAIDLLKWGYADLLKTNQEINISGLRNNLSGIENSFAEMSVEFRSHKKRTSFALLIDGLDNLSIDDLDWFQSTGIETFNSIPNSLIVIASHNELSWHAWEFKELCKRIPLSGFSLNDIKAICPSSVLAERTFQLSCGHPATVETLLGVANQKYRNISSVGLKELESFDSQLLKELKLQVDKNISARTKFAWLREVIWLAAAADRFDEYLLNDLTRRSGIKIPEDVADIALEIANTRLATWDSDSETYEMPTELRGRILQYYLNAEKGKYAQLLKDIAKYYQSRFRNSSGDAKTQIVLARDYLNRSQKIQLSSPENAYGTVRNRQAMSGSKVRGRKMQKTEMAGAQKIYVSRKSAEDIFKKLIKGELENKWILGIQGEAGIGKSYLVKKYKEIANSEKYPVVVLDLNSAKYRQREVFLNEIVVQSQIQSPQINKAMHPLTSKRSDKDVYMGIESTETFDYYTTTAATTIAVKLKTLVARNKRPIVIVDTFDDSPGINQLSDWLFEDVLPQFRDSIYLVVAGRKSLRDVVKGDLVKELKLIVLDRLANKDINEIAKRWKETSKAPINNKVIDTVERISNGNPLIASWVLFYASEFKNQEDLHWLVNVSDKTKALKKIANFILGKNRSTKLEYSTFRGLQAAIHFGSYFNLDLFKAAVPNSELGRKSHKAVFDHIASYFYVRSAVDNWTLHDEIREWMRAASKNDRAVPEFIELSQNAIQNYYDPRIKKLESKKKKSIEDQAILDNLRAQRLANLLYIRSEPNSDAQAKDYHLEIWGHLDALWHRYRLEQMAQVVQYGRDVQSWKPSAKDDTLLTNLLDAAQAWAYFSQAKYHEAKILAEKIINDKNAPRRLSSTARVIVGLLPTQNPEEAIVTYLEPARRTYLQVLDELVDDKLPSGEFTDGRVDIYLEIHQVLMSIGRMHLRHLYDLEKGKESLEEAVKLAQKDLKLPLYAATALNEWARILRFEGTFNEALNKATLAITIYKKEHERPEADVNFGYFYETLGLINKEQNQFIRAEENLNKALQIYSNIQGPMELRKATIRLELGHVNLLTGELDKAGELLLAANRVFKLQTEKHPWYYLNSIEKLGEYYVKKDDLRKAREYFEEQKRLSSRFGHDLWEYWAIQHLASIDYRQKRKVNVKDLEKTLIEYDQKRHRQFGPAFWRTKLLIYKIIKDKGDQSLALKHLVEGLAYLAEQWKPIFSDNFGLLRSEMLQFEPNELISEANRLRKLWKTRFSKKDPAPELIEFLDEITINLK